MPRPEKVAVVEEIKARFENSGGVILTEYRGLRVGEMQRLRRELRDKGAELKIVKNTLARLAVEGSNYSDIVEFFEGPVAIAFYEDDPVPTAKLLRGFATENPDLVIKGGLLSGEVIDAEAARKLADLESREVLLAKMAGAMQAPLTKLAGATSALIRNFGYALGGYLSAREDEEPPPAEPPGEEPEVEDQAGAEAPEAEAQEVEAPEEPASEDSSESDGETE
ncbi:MAG: 50S ribosomal protein L10 [Acidobacteria bacterium]|nr:MAG: 50S ribosomal protein L10 [Acidobacteriota bacterium]